MQLMDLSKNNIDLKAYRYELVELREAFRLASDAKTRESVVKRMRVVRKKIRECLDRRGYKSKKIGSIGFHAITESKKHGTVVQDSTTVRGRYGKPVNLRMSRALTYEEHQELLRKKRESEK